MRRARFAYFAERPSKTAAHYALRNLDCKECCVSGDTCEVRKDAVRQLRMYRAKTWVGRGSHPSLPIGWIEGVQRGRLLSQSWPCGQRPHDAYFMSQNAPLVQGGLFLHAEECLFDFCHPVSPIKNLKRYFRTVQAATTSMK